MNFTFKVKCYSFQKFIRVEFCKEFNSCIKIKDVTDKNKLGRGGVLGQVKRYWEY